MHFLGHGIFPVPKKRPHLRLFLFLQASRHPRKPGEALWPPDRQLSALLARVDGSDAVINLAGESIAGARWTPARKRAIRDSRVAVTSALATAIAMAPAPPPVFLSGSAIGFYGVRDDAPLFSEENN